MYENEKEKKKLLLVSELKFCNIWIYDFNTNDNKNYCYHSVLAIRIRHLSLRPKI